VILIDAADYILASPGRGQELSDARIRRRAQVIIGSVVDFFHLPTDTICAYIGEGEVAVLKASNKKNLATWVDQDMDTPQANPSWANLSALKRAGEALLSSLRHDTQADISIGIGRYHPGLYGLTESYQDARAALSLGCRFHGQNRVHCLDELGIAAFVGVSDEQTKIDLAVYLLGPLDHEPDLMATLYAFFAHDCCPSTTAADLTIHRNTLTYRLDKITSLTGLDPRRFDDAVQIRLALVLRSLQIDPRHCADAQLTGTES
jgi:carbohydrate diacid regulator